MKENSLWWEIGQSLGTRNKNVHFKLFEIMYDMVTHDCLWWKDDERYYIQEALWAVREGLA